MLLIFRRCRHPSTRPRISGGARSRTLRSRYFCHHCIRTIIFNTPIYTRHICPFYCTHVLLRLAWYMWSLYLCHHRMSCCYPMRWFSLHFQSKNRESTVSITPVVHSLKCSGIWSNQVKAMSRWNNYYVEGTRKCTSNRFSLGFLESFASGAHLWAVPTDITKTESVLLNKIWSRCLLTTLLVVTGQMQRDFDYDGSKHTLTCQPPPFACHLWSTSRKVT